MPFEDLPEKYQPAWFRDKLTPLKANIPMNTEDVKNQMTKFAKIKTEDVKQSKANRFDDEFTKQSANITILKEDDDIPIRSASVMQSADANMWYEDLSEEGDKVIDNNDDVDLEQAQIKAPEAISSIRQKLLLKNKPQELKQKNMFAAPGEYVLFYNKQVVDVGKLDKVKACAEDIIINNENLAEDDLVIFLRVPLGKIFK